jgi:hypothetical protein
VGASTHRETTQQVKAGQELLLPTIHGNDEYAEPEESIVRHDTRDVHGSHGNPISSPTANTDESNEESGDGGEYINSDDSDDDAMDNECISHDKDENDNDALVEDQHIPNSEESGDPILRVSPADTLHDVIQSILCNTEFSTKELNKAYQANNLPKPCRRTLTDLLGGLACCPERQFDQDLILAQSAHYALSQKESSRRRGFIACVTERERFRLRS